MMDWARASSCGECREDESIEDEVRPDLTGMPVSGHATLPFAATGEPAREVARTGREAALCPGGYREACVACMRWTGLAPGYLDCRIPGTASVQRCSLHGRRRGISDSTRAQERRPRESAVEVMVDDGVRKRQARSRWLRRRTFAGCASRPARTAAHPMPGHRRLALTVDSLLAETIRSLSTRRSYSRPRQRV